MGHKAVEEPIFQWLWWRPTSSHCAKWHAEAFRQLAFPSVANASVTGLGRQAAEAAGADGGSSRPRWDY